MLNFQTDTAARLHPMLHGIASGTAKLQEVFDLFLSLMINRYAGKGQPNDQHLGGCESSARVELAGSQDLLTAVEICHTGMLKEQADVLGDLFDNAGFGDKSRGQTLTPEPLAEYLARETIGQNGTDAAINICDPCCGSGRFLLAAGKLAPHAMLYGVDIDPCMASMSAVNLAVFGYRGMIVCADIFAIAPGPLEDGSFECAYEIGRYASGTIRIVRPNQATAAAHTLLWC